MNKSRNNKFFPNGLFTLVVAFLVPLSAHAVPPSFSAGPNIGYGYGSDTSTIFSAISNPAMAAYSSVKEDNKLSGVASSLLSFYGSVEFGPIDDLNNKFDTLQDILDDDSNENQGQDAAVESINVANSILAEIGGNGYFKGGFVFHVPLFPLTIESFGGTVAFDANVSNLLYTRL